MMEIGERNSQNIQKMFNEIFQNMLNTMQKERSKNVDGEFDDTEWKSQMQNLKE